MRKYLVACLIALLTLTNLAGAAPDPKPGNRATKGTTQLAGDNGKLGVTYTIGKGSDAINFTLLSAEYTTSRVVVPGRILVPKANEKFVVLHYTLHNPNQRDFAANWTALNFTAIDSKNVNRPFAGSSSVLGVKEGTTEPAAIALKPAQKVSLWSAVLIPADATTPKLIVQRGAIVPVLRIYLKPNEVKPVAAPFADPADASGATARAEAPGEAGVFYQAGHFDVKLAGTGYVEGKLGGREPRPGERWFVATVVVKSSLLQPWTLNGFTYQTCVKTSDGEKSRWLSGLTLKAQRDEAAGQSLGPGEEYTVRLCTPVPRDAAVTEFCLRPGEGLRALVFAIEGAG